jgi:MoaA/NifB/PqqE/SkfB family radical SAM enzyme
MNPFCDDKILTHPEAIARYATAGVTPPILVELDMTNACSHLCPQCVGGRNENYDALTIVEAVDYLRQMAAYGVKAVTFTGGGEPLMSRATLDAVDCAADLGLDVGLITNGSLLIEEASHRLLARCTWIRVSLDADCPATFLQTHGLGETDYRQVVENIRGAAKMKREMGASCTLGVGYLTGPQTWSGMSSVARQFRDSGVDYLQFRPFHGGPNPNAAELEEFSQYETETYRILFARAKYETHGPRTYTYCHAANFIGVIQADGNMPLCCHLRGYPTLYIGSLKERSFKAIWEGQQKAAVLDAIDVQKCLPSCRCDTHNRILSQVLTSPAHQNFL